LTGEKEKAAPLKKKGAPFEESGFDHRFFPGRGRAASPSFKKKGKGRHRASVRGRRKKPCPVIGKVPASSRKKDPVQKREK